jgi:U1 small nuclear ribonucleoprotein 70kDa
LVVVVNTLSNFLVLSPSSCSFIGNPYNDQNIKGDPFRTLFVSNLSYSTDEKSLRESLQIYGRIRRVRIVHDEKTHKSRGYAFVEFDSDSDFQSKRYLYY